MIARQNTAEILPDRYNDDSVLEVCSCPLCESSTSSVIESFGTFRVLRCECDFVYQSPRLSEAVMMTHYEDESYFAGSGTGYSNYAAQEIALRMTFRALLKNIEKKGHAGGSLLEIGCGYGFLLDEARDYFSVRWGTEYNDEAIKVAMPQADMIVRGGLEELRRHPARFDCIILNHVIEHVYHPVGFAADLLTFLKPGGVVVMAAPNIDSPLRYLMGKKWPSYKVPEHVSYFSRRTLGRLLRESGLINIQDIPYPHAFPISLLMSKFGITVSQKIGSRSLWVPGTTICCLGQRT